MAMKSANSKDKSTTKVGPSPYGSHLSMLDEEMTNKLNDKKYVVLKDEDGAYITERNRLDNKLTDSYRNASKEYREKLLVNMMAIAMAEEEFNTTLPENGADEDIKNGKVKEFNTAEDMISSLQESWGENQ